MAERKLVFSQDEDKKKPPERVHAKQIAHRSTKKIEETRWQKFARKFLAEDVDNIGSYVLDDLIIPMGKDVFVNFINALLWGTRGSGSSYRDSSKRKTDYSRISTVGRIGSGERERERERRRREREDYDDERRQFDILSLPFDTKSEAEVVLDKLEDYIMDYGRVQTGYLYELIGETGPYTAEYYGWTSLRAASIKRVGRGFILTLPTPVRID